MMTRYITYMLTRNITDDDYVMTRRTPTITASTTSPHLGCHTRTAATVCPMPGVAWVSGVVVVVVVVVVWVSGAHYHSTWVRPRTENQVHHPEEFPETSDRQD